MAIDLVTKYLPYVDELFATESKKELLTNQDFSFKGAHTVKIYKVSTGKMNDYGRSGPESGNWSRYGEVESLNATTQTCTLSKCQKTVPLLLPLTRWIVMRQGILWRQLQHWRGRSGKW